MREERVAAEGQHLDPSLCELWHESGHRRQLRGADGREIVGVGEKDGPSPLDVVMESDGSLCRLRHEIRYDISKLQRHWWGEEEEEEALLVAMEASLRVAITD